MAKVTIAEIRKAILKAVPKRGSAAGNHSHMKCIAQRPDARVKDDRFLAKNSAAGNFRVMTELEQFFAV